MRTRQAISLLFILIIISINITPAISATDTNDPVNDSMDLSKLVPYGDTIKNNIWIFIFISCIIGIISLFRDRIPFFHSKVIHRDGIVQREEYYRYEMINQVRNIWINGFLANSLYNIITIELGLDECRDKINLRGNLAVQQPNDAPKQLPSSVKIIDVFDDLGHSFLILGEPGSGKTILLLQLARGLLDRAEGDASHPIPVIFHLSAWAVRRSSLADWLVDELAMRYSVSKSLGNKWVNEDKILPLLDGLDEVAKEYREACVEAINKFREQHEHGLLPLVVCSRSVEYDALKVRLNLPTAIIVKPLTRPQIEQYLKSIGKPMDGIQIALQDDPILWELLETPLMLNIVTMAFKGKSADLVRGIGGIDERRIQVFHAYKQAMFSRPGRTATTSYAQEQAEHWLSWLAKSMKRRNQSIFYLESIQADWMPSPWLKRFIKMSVVLVAWLGSGLIIGLSAGLKTGLGVGLFIGLGAGQVTWTNQTVPKFRAERLHLKTPKKLVSVLVRGLLIGLGAGLITGLTVGVGSDLAHGLAAGLASWLAIWLFIGSFRAIERKELSIRRYPNEGIHASANNALTMGLGVGLASWLAGWMGAGLFMEWGVGQGVKLMPIGLFLGLYTGMIFGGFACIEHFLLRIMLWFKNFAPWDYAKFLDYAADRIFLRKVGGGYVFIHKNIMDYFASLEQDEA